MMKINNDSIKENFFYYTDLHNFHKKLTWKTKTIFVIIFLALLITSLTIIGFNFAPLGDEVFLDRLKKVFMFSNSLKDYPDESLIGLSIDYLWISIKTVLVGTTLGFVLAFITSTMQNDKLHNLKWLSYPFKIIIPILRAMPVIFFVYLFSYNFSKEISLIMIYFWFSWIWSHKYLNEYYSSVNYYFYNVSIYEGNGRFISYLKNVLPQINNKMISLFLYSFDSNIRWSSLLGTLGMIGIGELIYKAQDNQFQSMGIPVLTIIVFLLFLEGVIYLINRLVLTVKDVQFNSTNIDLFMKKINWKYYVKLLLMVLLIALILYSFFSISWNEPTFTNNTIIKALFQPNWDVFYQNSNINIFNDIVMLILQTITIMFIALVVGIFFLFISSYKLFRNYSLIGICILTILRSIPLIALFFLINPIYVDPISTICLILGFFAGLNLSKTLNESINKISDKEILIMELEGNSKIRIFFKFIMYKIYFDWINLFLFTWENQIRDIVTYGKYGSCTIGIYIDIFFSGTKKEYNNMTALIWISFFINLIFMFIFFVIKEKMFSNYFLYNFKNVKKYFVKHKKILLKHK